MTIVTLDWNGIIGITFKVKLWELGKFWLDFLGGVVCPLAFFGGVAGFTGGVATGLRADNALDDERMSPPCRYTTKNNSTTSDDQHQKSTHNTMTTPQPNPNPKPTLESHLKGRQNLQKNACLPSALCEICLKCCTQNEI